MKALEWLLTAFFSSGVNKIIVKLVSEYDKFLFMSIAYFISCVFALIMREKFGKGAKINLKKSVISGVLIGTVNFFAFFILLTALTAGPASTIFPILSMNTIVIIILSILIYKEKLTKRSLIGIVCSIIAILLLR